MNGNERKQNQFQEKVVDKSTVEAAWAGIPELSLSPGSTKDEPVLIDKRYYNREYEVKDGEIYTIRLEMHSHPKGLGAFTRDSAGVCILPTISSKAHVIAELNLLTELLHRERSRIAGARTFTMADMRCAAEEILDGN